MQTHNEYRIRVGSRIAVRRRIRWCAAFVGVLVVVVAGTAHGQGQYSGRNATTIVTDGAPIFLLPDASRTPLTKLQAGTSVRILGIDGEWVNLEFRDGIFGARKGYVLKMHVKLPETTTPRNDDQRLRALQAAARRAEAAAATASGAGSPQARCQNISCIPPSVLMNVRPPMLVNPRISETVRRGED
jgi:hypothetical protein